MGGTLRRRFRASKGRRDVMTLTLPDAAGSALGEHEHNCARAHDMTFVMTATLTAPRLYGAEAVMALRLQRRGGVAP